MTKRPAPLANVIEQPTVYCRECGRKLEARVIEHTRYLPNYDSATGKKLTYYEWKCPKAHWWNNHTCISQDHSYYP